MKEVEKKDLNILGGKIKIATYLFLFSKTDTLLKDDFYLQQLEVLRTDYSPCEYGIIFITGFLKECSQL